MTPQSLGGGKRLYNRGECRQAVIVHNLGMFVNWSLVVEGTCASSLVTCICIP